MKKRLFTPGPTPVPEHIQLKMAAPIIHHRSTEFQEILQSVAEKLGQLFLTSGPVVILAGSGTAGMESVVSSIHQPGDRAIFVDGGKFGERWGDLLATYQVESQIIKKQWGMPPTVEEIIRLIQTSGPYSALYLTHSETSTGTLTDIKNIAEHVKKMDPSIRIVVDGITSVGCQELRMDDWQLDYVITGSQKGLMIPPGLSLVAIHPNQVDPLLSLHSQSYYLSLQQAVLAAQKNDTPWTPAVSLIIGLDAALSDMLEIGMEAVWKRHQRLADSLRTGLSEIGIRLLSQNPSNAVTTAWLPKDVEWKPFNHEIKANNGMTIAGGQNEYAGKIFRISHLGYYDDFDMITVMAGIERALYKCGYSFELGKGVSAVHHNLIRGMV